MLDLNVVLYFCFLLFLLVLAVVISYNTPRAKAERAHIAEEYRQQAEKRKIEEKEEAEQKAKQANQLKEFRKQNLVVYIREKDGRKSAFEAILIRMLIETGITVEPLLENNGKAIASGDISFLKNGLLAIVGTSWCKNGTGTNEEFSTYEWESTYCDYRLLATKANTDTGKILGAGCDHCTNEVSLAKRIILDLASTFSVMPEVN